MSAESNPTEAGLPRHRLNLFDATMIVVGSMVGSGIFIVPAEMARLLGSPGWLLVAWLLTGLLTVSGAVVYGELAGMFPRAGGQYVFLREAFSPLWGFLYGWTLFTVIQTGTIAAVAVAFARFTGVIWPVIAEDNYLVAPVALGARHAISLSTAQLTALLVIALLTWANIHGLRYGKWLQNSLTVAKVAALGGLIGLGLTWGWNAEVVAGQRAGFWTPRPLAEVVPGVSAVTTWGLLAALAVAQVGSLFSADSWHVISFAAEEVENPRRNLPLSMALGTLLVTGLYLLANVAYLAVLPLEGIARASSERVGTAVMEAMIPQAGGWLMAVAIMISTLGCDNGLILSGARAYYAMARDGLFFRGVGRLGRAGTPTRGLLLQAAWAMLLVLPRTYDPQTGAYGNLYGALLDYVVSAALLFYLLTIVGLVRLRWLRPDAPRPVVAWGYPWVPALYIVGSVFLLAMLVLYRPQTTWPGLALVATGVPVYWLWRGRTPGGTAP
ncbi:MAG: APC family permease [Planctomycetaceae bacterium]